jgi:hypothetical protein
MMLSASDLILVASPIAAALMATAGAWLSYRSVIVSRAERKAVEHQSQLDAWKSFEDAASRIAYSDNLNSVRSKLDEVLYVYSTIPQIFPQPPETVSRLSFVTYEPRFPAYVSELLTSIVERNIAETAPDRVAVTVTAEAIMKLNFSHGFATVMGIVAQGLAERRLKNSQQTEKVKR